MTTLPTTNKLYAYYDYLDIDRTISYLSYLLGETVTDIEISFLVWAGHLMSYRDDFVTLRAVTIKDNKIVSFGDYQYKKRISIFPNVKYAIPYDLGQGTQYAYLIKDAKGKTYTAINLGDQVITPYMELKLKEDVVFNVQDLITLANTANTTANKESIPKPIPPEKIPFRCFNDQTNKYEDLYLINLHQQDIPTQSYEEELPTNRKIPKETLLIVIGILLERLINKNKTYRNNNLSQSRIVNDILEQYPEVKTLGKRNLDQILAESNTLLKGVKLLTNQKDKQ